MIGILGTTSVVALLLVVLGVVLGAVGLSLLARGLFWGYPRAVLPPSAFLSAKEQAIVTALADALFPSGGPIPISGTEAGLVSYMDEYVRRTPPHMRLLIRLLFLFIEHGPWLFGPRHVRFTRQRPEERVAALADMASSSIYFRRVSFLSIRTMLSMGYLANPAVARRIGWVEQRAPFESVEVVPSTAKELVA
ncbi:MAG: hypothetical protein HUU21_29525 [Polyangiaceae bacterium]|nr:hypothetical protein [Polyangiaceae bacterium]